ncbi:MAG: hypothetical protein A3F95_02655 [Candidatus Nealsonbacteria bacterium RIFCSPLOWO2_12_FULL_39_31]|uniref:Uncharacterized protein n=1 Tax=Candidatus Nealsonbacteria bacterium RIFCSPLOWO2_12_FULL_39_31 TaxID=1801676 RepID=A0A1G2EMI8_9BACT|nr:MAG: hypothetical protein A3C48_02515 [Candidatus Nealsonbacteria bacterium RIFCSPHIGHO2_02_FULL_38_75]OGZ25664.1 MAG: hypothetical protein A3I85_03390 [Candidatus Nealsonbacteria bacterium RIFCSPLOWO2_02_FULL_38_63]OGZ26762.1 MAG: hypothetical protein A3F95_02655 [Candidatus Nealsonbacteria bacterium RIFCSPLOWO2_12_FULL_39_31]
MKILIHKQFVRNKKTYFYPPPPKMSSKLEKLLGKIEKDVKNSKNISPALISKREIKKYFQQFIPLMIWT